MITNPTQPIAPWNGMPPTVDRYHWLKNEFGEVVPAERLRGAISAWCVIGVGSDMPDEEVAAHYTYVASLPEPPVS